MPTSQLPSDCVGAKILVVDDDGFGRVVVAEALRRLGFVVTEAGDGLAGLDAVQRDEPDLVLLDIEMPRLNGRQTLERLRDAGYRKGVIMLTASHATDEIVRALGNGADDFVAKPCQLRELLARVNAVLRRVLQGPSAGALEFGEVKVDLRARTATRNGEPLALTQTEFKLLEVLDAAQGRALTREELLTKVWGYSSNAQTRTVDTHVWRLRRKLSDAAQESHWIRTVPGGYRLSREPLAPSAAAS